MRMRSVGLVLVGVLLWSGSPLAHGQKAVERFIPLGQSPGLSGTVTVMGTVEAVDARARRITIDSPGEASRATVTDDTRIWLDRSRLRRPVRNGSFQDLRPGLPVEVKYREDAERGRGEAEWIKVQGDPLRTD